MKVAGRRGGGGGGGGGGGRCWSHQNSRLSGLGFFVLSADTWKHLAAAIFFSLEYETPLNQVWT